MSRCEFCGKEMLRAKSCVGTKYQIDGKLYNRIRFGEEGDMSAGYVNESSRCGDCGCRYGGLHHPGCDLETCPACGGQFLSCDHGDVYLVKETRKMKKRAG